MPELDHAGLRYTTHRDVYDPSDDTWLLIESLDIGAGERFLEVGCGAGLVAIAAAKRGAHVTASDTNLQALRLARENAQRNQVTLRLVRADLLRGVSAHKFDVVAFNPPYLPTEAAERLEGPLNRAFDGGPTGRDVTSAFLDQIGRAPPRHTLLVASTLQDLASLERLFRAHGLRFTSRRRKALSHEALLVYDLFASQK